MRLDALKTQFGGNRLRVKTKTSARKRTPAIRRNIIPGRPVIESLDVTNQRPSMCEEIVRHQDWLSMLKVGPTRHCRVTDVLGALDQNPHALHKDVPQGSRGIPGIHPHERSYLIVAAAPCSEGSPEGLPDMLDQDALKGTMDILIRFPGVHTIR